MKNENLSLLKILMVKTEQNGPENIVDERNFKLQSI